jgi:hypothetical protein
MAVCAALQYLKGSFIKAFVIFFAALCASIVAFGYFEKTAQMLFIGRDMIPGWAQLISFLLLFILTLAILAAFMSVLAKHPINLGLIPERIGRAVFGLALGFIVSGMLLTAIGMAPISNEYPYKRLQSAASDPRNPSKVLLNPDGFITGLFGLVSSGSLSGENSFAVVHADYLNQLFFSRFKTGREISVLGVKGSIRLPDKAAAWPAPKGLKDTEGESVSSKSGYDLIIVRIGLTSSVIQAGGAFVPGQIRLMCKEKDDKEPFKGIAEVSYPEGFLKAPDQLQLIDPGEPIKVESSEIKDGVKWFDFAFYIPSGSRPVAVTFKANVIAAIPQMVASEQAPE